ncbi:hypothetical protein MIMGU_mgv11b020762mg [Erythranthe guttata]|uniref:Uncharacterized protein n=1 Tax=Erythranthe guttata TaxID=4155 RepID=A0A022RNM7_ERYGU|nr:hypothetical protein MIMGU_mgv11b020762mg [Erythranthe guttata]
MLWKLMTNSHNKVDNIPNAFYIASNGVAFQYGPHLKKLLCLSFSNRAEARARLSDHTLALTDCEEALRIDDSHFKTLVCKGKILLSLNRYSAALCCFNAANLGPQATENSDLVNGFLEKCKRLEFLSRTGAFDISKWVLSGFRGKSPELAEYIGALDIKKSEISGRGLFATKNVESGTLLFVTKAVAVDRARCSTVQKASVVLDGREGGGDAEVFPGWEDNSVISRGCIQRTQGDIGPTSQSIVAHRKRFSEDPCAETRIHISRESSLFQHKIDRMTIVEFKIDFSLEPYFDMPMSYHQQAFQPEHEPPFFLGPIDDA